MTESEACGVVLKGRRVLGMDGKGQMGRRGAQQGCDGTEL